MAPGPIPGEDAFHEWADTVKIVDQQLFVNSKGNRRGWNLRGTTKIVFRGTAHPFWKGDAARSETKRRRAQMAYALSECERCGKPATDRHHKDDDTGNNARENIQLLCRRCHMEVDGRLSVFAELGKANAKKMTKPPQQCSHCKRLKKPLRKGLCGACNEYRRRNGRDRPLEKQ